ncbi:uncharacterized protein LOC130614227 [Hydractinia symbiolongicarpus]|uniref:uncharacterized protein LOC130614227 n=1 Tax=Hydractinia symbiolongicarpus TaxID=13093 RepID=UPI00254BDA66|nr:uncharacterized protein LOC130614227 [Hydractinia symbiolongicarpus]
MRSRKRSMWKRQIFTVFLFLSIIFLTQSFSWEILSREQPVNGAKQEETSICTKEIDIVLLIDSSGSVHVKWDEIIDAAQILQANFNVNDNSTRVGIIDISAIANVYKHLDSNNTNEEVFQILERLRPRPQNGITNMELGLEMVLKVMFSSNPMRPNCRKALVVYTDIAIQNGAIKDYFVYMTSNHIDVYFVQVGPTPANSEITHMAEARLINAYNLSQSGLGQESIEHSICYGETLVKSSSAVTSIEEKDGSLYAHNKLRDMHGVPPLEWDTELAKIAHDWAYHLAMLNNGLSHSSMTTYSESLGLHYGGDSYMHSYETSLLWYKTIKYYNFNNPMYNYLAGTFTQMVWKSTVKFGFGIAYRNDTKTTFTVATYAPKGNYEGQFADNVPPPVAGLPPRIPDISELIYPKLSKQKMTKEECAQKYGTLSYCT